MAVRRYKRGDEDQILPLFERVFNHSIDYNLWKWKYIDNPCTLNPFILVYEEKGRILGHTALWVYRAKIMGISHKIGLRMDAMVDPKARGKGIYKQLSEQLIVEAEKEGISLLYGFPAKGAKALLLQYTEAQHVTNVNRWVYVNKPVSLIASKIKPLKLFSFIDYGFSFMKGLSDRQKIKKHPFIHKVTSFTNAPTCLSLKERIYLQRDIDYLNWRYVKHPTNNYEILQWNEQGETKGYIVYCVLTNKQNLKVGYIVDLIATGAQRENIEQSLLIKALEQMKGTSLIQAWTLPGQDNNLIFRKAGFFIKDSPMPFVVTNINSEMTDITDPQKWFISMGDVDSF